jgi:hypothetical protein
MSDESSTAVADPRTGSAFTGPGACSGGSDVERPREATAPTIADLAAAPAGSVVAAVALATIHDDRDVGVVLITLDQAGVHLFAELGRHD